MRLIDADALLEHIKRLECHAHNLKYEQGLNDCLQCYFPQIIENQPTAFNQDEVIHKIHCHFIDRIDDAEPEEIEKLKHDNKVICNIIRNGGKEQGMGE